MQYLIQDDATLYLSRGSLVLCTLFILPYILWGLLLQTASTLEHSPFVLLTTTKLDLGLIAFNYNFLSYFHYLSLRVSAKKRLLIWTPPSPFNLLYRICTTFLIKSTLGHPPSPDVLYVGRSLREISLAAFPIRIRPIPSFLLLRIFPIPDMSPISLPSGKNGVRANTAHGKREGTCRTDVPILSC